MPGQGKSVLDKLKHFGISLVVIVIAQLVLAGPEPTSAWWGASAELAGASMDRVAGWVSSASSELAEG